MKSSIFTVKRLHMCFALAGLALWAAQSRAQSSVTLYGVVDGGLSYVSNSGGHSQIMQSGGNSAGNRWGLRGVEDLGGGLSAIVTLENGFNTTTGAFQQGGALFGRQAFVGLSSVSAGTATFGRQYAASTLAVGPFTSGNSWAASGSLLGTHPGDIDNFDSSNRLNNSVKYFSPSILGLHLSGDYSFGGVSGAPSQKQIYSLGLTYAYSGFQFAAGYLNSRQPNFSFWGGVPSSSTTANNITSPVFAGYSTAHTQQIAGVAASYTIGGATLALVYSNIGFLGLGSTAVTGLNAAESQYRGNVHFNDGELNFKWRVVPALQLGVAFNYLESPGAGLGSVAYRSVNLGADYALSKSTSLYSVAVYQHASGVDSTGKRAVAAITALTPSSSADQLVVTAGIRHVF